MEIAWFGHSGSHTSQLMHWSVILSATLALAARRLAAHPFGGHRVHERRDVAAQHRDLANDRRRQEEVLVRGREEERLDTRGEAAIHARQLEFVFEVRDGAQAPQDD